MIPIHHSYKRQQNLTSFTYRFFHFKKPLGVGLAFDATERMENVAAHNAKEIKRVAAEQKEKEESFFAVRE